MMKKNISLLIAAIAACILVGSCSSGQKPTPRNEVWRKTSESENNSTKHKKLVPFQRTGSELAEVQVSLNGVPFNMWWDTGASMLCISTLEFTKMYKEGKISDKDFKGEINSTIADGSTVKNKVYTIREVFIQGKDNKYLRLSNIDAIISDNLGAPLLIGQNVIQQLPKHTFNERTAMIEFEE